MSDERLRELDEYLSAAPVVEPPPDLAQRILAGVRLTGEVRPARRSWRFALPAVTLGYAVAAAAGALLFAAVQGFDPGLLDVPDLSQVLGTLSPDAVGDNDSVLDSLVLETRGISSLARLRRDDGALVLDFRIDSDRPLRVDVELVGAAPAFEAVVQPRGRQPTIRMEQGRLSIDGTGRTTVLAFLRGDAEASGSAELRIEFSSEGQLLKEGVLSTDKQ